MGVWVAFNFMPLQTRTKWIDYKEVIFPKCVDWINLWKFVIFIISVDKLSVIWAWINCLTRMWETHLPGLINKVQWERVGLGTSLVVQWLRLHAPSAGDLNLIPGWGTRSWMLQIKILHATTKTQNNQKKKKKKRLSFCQLVRCKLMVLICISLMHKA